MAETSSIGYEKAKLELLTSFTVNTTNDTHDTNPGNGVCADSNEDCSLRAAIEETNVLFGADTIYLPANIYNLVNGQLVIADALTIYGDDPSTTIIDAQSNSRVFMIDKTGGANLIRVVLSYLTIQNGNISGDGGGIWNNETLVVADSSIISNTSVTNGGGIYNTGGSLTITNSVIGDNFVSDANGGGGGGIYSTYGEVIISDTLITSNTCDGQSNIDGGGIYNKEGEFLLVNSLVDGNIVTTTDLGSAALGGGIYNDIDGNFSIIGSMISNNSALGSGFMVDGIGGGIFNSYPTNLSIDQSIIKNNMSTTFGGGISNSSGNISIQDTTIMGNISQAGGGITSAGTYANITIENSTISSNLANENGGGVYHAYGSMTLLDSTVSSNVANLGGGILSGGVLTLSNSTIGMNVAPAGGQSIFNALYGTINTKSTIFDDGIFCVSSDPINSSGYNLIEYTNCDITPAEGDIVGEDPLIALLADNGGETFTHALLPDSPAIDTGNCIDIFGDPVTTDQRGVARPQGYNCDIGSYELERSLTLIKSVAPSDFVSPGSPLTYTLNFYNSSIITYTGVLITDIVPVYLHDITYYHDGCAITPSGSISYTWLVEDLSPGEDGIITITGWVNTGLPGGFVFTNTGVITASNLETGTTTNTSWAVVTIANTPPVAVNDIVSTSEDVPIVIAVLANDSDLNGDELAISGMSIPLHGTATISGTDVVYSPAVNFNGTDLFTYTLTDGVLQDSAEVSITIIPVNDPPLVFAGPDQTADEGMLLHFTGIITDVDDTTNDVEWNFGDGTILTNTLVPSHTFINDGNYTVTLTTSDFDGGVGSDMLLVTIANVVPTLGSLDNVTVTAGLPVTATITFTDPGLLDPHTLTIQWTSDISETFELVAGVSQISVSHMFMTPNTYIVTVTVIDDSGLGSSEKWIVIVRNAGYLVRLPIVMKLNR